jgi:purine-binding chemotaxis protein CheW
MSQQYCTFLVAEHLFGIEVSKIQEVVRHQTLTPVPLAPSEVSGLINLRGQIITAIDLRTRLGLPRLPADQSAMNLFVTGEDGTFSFQVDRIGDVVEVDENSLEEPPATIPPVLRGLIRSVSKLQNGLLLMLNESRAMELPA